METRVLHATATTPHTEHTAPPPDVADAAAGSTDLARARLTGARSQRAFRLLLDTLARPGRLASTDGLGLPAGLPTPLLVPLALADVEVSVAVVTDDPESPWPALVRDVTGSRPAQPGDAHLVVLLDGFGPGDVLALRRGTADAPEGGARVAIACRSLRGLSPDDTLPPRPSEAAGPGDEAVLELRGPGIPDVRRLLVGGLPLEVLDALAVANDEFPCGVDTWLCAPDGAVAGLPRSTRTTLLHREEN